MPQVPAIVWGMVTPPTLPVNISDSSARRPCAMWNRCAKHPTQTRFKMRPASYCWSPLRPCRPLSAALCRELESSGEDKGRFIDSQAGIYQLSQ